jgi:methionyl-tRNA formyltransferase
MRMARGLDTGDVLARARIPLAAADTTGSLTRKLSTVAAMLLLETLPRLARGEIVPQPQDDAAASYAGEITAGDGEIDWRRPAAETHRRLRAFDPWPGSHTSWRGQRLKVIAAVPYDDASLPAAGAIGQVVVGPGRPPSVLVVTGEGTLELLELQLAGKRPVSAIDFLRGQPALAGSVLGGDS